MEFTIYSVGDVQFLYQILNSVAMICGTGDFTKLVSVGFLMGILFIGFQTIYQGGQRINLPQVLTCFIVYLCMFGPSCTVVIEDTFSAKTRVVDNVPLGVGASGMAISNIGFKLTQMFEQGFGDVERTTEHGFADNLRILNNLRDMSMSDALFSAIDSGLDRTNSAGGRTSSKEALRNYLSECTFVNVAQGAISVEDLSHAGWGNAFKSSSQAHGTFLPLPNIPNNGYVSCNDGWDYLNNALNTATNSANFRQAVNRELKILDSTGNGPDDVAPAADFDRLESALSSVGADLQDTQFMMKSLVLDSVYDEAAEKFYSSYQDRTSAAAIRQAIMQRNTQWASESVMFLNVARALMAFFEGFLYAITPLIAFLLGIGSFGLSLAGKYFLLIAWIQLWMPVMAITNLYVAIGARGDISSHLGNGVSIYSFSQVWADVASWIATGGMLCAATPMIALFLITGSHYAFTSLAGRLGGQDHFNEKTVTPDVAQNAPVIQNAAMASHSVGKGTVMADASIPKINLGQMLSNGVLEREANIRALSRQVAVMKANGIGNTVAAGTTDATNVNNSKTATSTGGTDVTGNITNNVQVNRQASQTAVRESSLNSSLKSQAGISFGGNGSFSNKGLLNDRANESWSRPVNDAANNAPSVTSPTHQPSSTPINMPGVNPGLFNSGTGVPSADGFGSIPLGGGFPTPFNNGTVTSPADGIPQMPNGMPGNFPTPQNPEEKKGPKHTRSIAKDAIIGRGASADFGAGVNAGGNIQSSAGEKAASSDAYMKTAGSGKGAGKTETAKASYINKVESDYRNMTSDQIREEATKTDNQAYSDLLNKLASEMDAKEKLMSMQKSFGMNQELDLAQATNGMSADDTAFLDSYINNVVRQGYAGMSSNDKALFNQIEHNAQKYKNAFGGGAIGEIRGRAAAQMAFLLQSGEADNMEFMQNLLSRNAHAVQTHPGMQMPEQMESRNLEGQFEKRVGDYKEASNAIEQKHQESREQHQKQKYSAKDPLDHQDRYRDIVDKRSAKYQGEVRSVEQKEALDAIQNPPKQILSQEWASDLDYGAKASLIGDVTNPAKQAEYDHRWDDLDKEREHQRITGLTDTQSKFVGIARRMDTLLDGRSLGEFFTFKDGASDEMPMALNQLRKEISHQIYGKDVSELNQSELQEVNKTTTGMALHLMGMAKAPNEGHAVAVKRFNSAWGSQD